MSRGSGSGRDSRGWRGLHPALRKRPAFALLELAIQMRGALREELAEDGLTIEMAQLVLVAAAVDGLSQSGLAARSGIDRTRTSQTMATLEAEGLVTQETNAWDRRQLAVFLTQPGSEEAAKIGEAVERAERSALRGLGRRERERLGQLAARPLPGHTGVTALRFAGQSRTRPA